MAGINKVIIVGHLGNDPEIRTMPNGEKSPSGTALFFTAAKQKS